MHTVRTVLATIGCVSCPWFISAGAKFLEDLAVAALAGHVTDNDLMASLRQQRDQAPATRLRVIGVDTEGYTSKTVSVEKHSTAFQIGYDRLQNCCVDSPPACN
jgi:hypothetical protein